MTPNQVLLDAIFDLIDYEEKHKIDGMISGLEQVILAFCIDSGMSEKDVRTKLNIRRLRARQTRKKLSLVSGKMTKSLDNFTARS